MHLSRSFAQPVSRLLWRLATLVPLVSTTLIGVPSATPAVAAVGASSCQFRTPSGAASPITHVIHIQFDNVHFRRDNPSVPSDLEQMPHLLNFIEGNGTLLANEHTPLISHTANDLLTGITGVYGDQHGIPISNSFEVYNNSPVGSYNTSAFTYWTDRVKQDPVNAQRVMPFQMIDAHGNNLQAPWVPYVNAGCNFGAVSTVNMVLENAVGDVNQVFGANSPEAADPNKFVDFVGIAVHCADTTCSTVGNGSGAHAKPELGGQGLGALYGHKYVATQVSNITETDGTPITGFTKGFDPTSRYTLGYVLALLQANVPVVYGYIADAHDSRNDCAPTTAANPTVSNTGSDGKPCGSYAPGEPGYVQQLKDWDTGFQEFFNKLDGLGINKSNTLFVFHSDENDHYAGSAPLNPGCDGVTTPCQYDRTKLGEITTDLPLLLKQQGLYDYANRPGFTNADLPYGIDFDTAPGFWLKGHPANGSAPVRKLEGALAAVTAPNPYTGKTEKLFRFLIDEPGLRALHMVTSDADRTAGMVGFGAEDHYNQIFSLINSSKSPPTSSCNQFPGPNDATCLSNGFIWLHGNYEPAINNTWAALVGPGVTNAGVDHHTWADHADLRPTMMSLLCLKDNYTHEGRALVENLNRSVLPDSVQESRGAVIALGRTFKQLNAPVGLFGRDAIQVSTTAIKGDSATYTSLENQLQNLVTERDATAAAIEAQLDKLPGCSGFAAATSEDGDSGSAATLERLNEQGRNVLEKMRRLAGTSQPESDESSASDN
jgi:hypothetical protein